MFFITAPGISGRQATKNRRAISSGGSSKQRDWESLEDFDLVNLDYFTVKRPGHLTLEILVLGTGLQRRQCLDIAFFVKLDELAVAQDDTEAALGATLEALLGVASQVFALAGGVNNCASPGFSERSSAHHDGQSDNFLHCSLFASQIRVYAHKRAD